MESLSEIFGDIPWDKLLVLAAGIVFIIGGFLLLMMGVSWILNKAQKKSNPHRIGLFMQLIIYLCFLYALYRSAGSLVLACFGEETTGYYTSVNYRKESDRAEPGRSFVQYEYYDFSVDGQAYHGGVFYMTDFPGEKSSTLLVTYLPAFPSWNEPSGSAQFREMGAKGVALKLFVTTGVLFLWILILRKNEPLRWRKGAHARWEDRQKKLQKEEHEQ